MASPSSGSHKKSEGERGESAESAESADGRLLAKLFSEIIRHRLVVANGTHGENAQVHWFAPDPHTRMCDAFTNEAFMNVVLGMAPRARWSAHVIPVHAIHVSRRHRMGCVVMEEMQVSLHTWRRTASDEAVLVLLFQVAATLHVLQKTFAFKHNDLHDHNVLVRYLRPSDGALFLAKRHIYIIDDVRYVVPNIGVMAQIMDFQFASLSLGSVRVGRADMFPPLPSTLLELEHTARLARRSALGHPILPPKASAGAGAGSGSGIDISPTVTLAWTAQLTNQWGYDLQVLCTSLHVMSPKSLRRLINCVYGALAAPTTPTTTARPQKDGVSPVKPAVFLMRVFGGIGSRAVRSWRRPTPCPKRAKTCVVVIQS